MGDEDAINHSDMLNFVRQAGAQGLGFDSEVQIDPSSESLLVFVKEQGAKGLGSTPPEPPTAKKTGDKAEKEPEKEKGKVKKGPKSTHNLNSAQSFGPNSSVLASSRGVVSPPRDFKSPPRDFKSPPRDFKSPPRSMKSPPRHLPDSAKSTQVTFDSAERSAHSRFNLFRRVQKAKMSGEQYQFAMTMIFDVVDKDSDGVLSREEFLECGQLAFKDLDTDQLHLLFTKLDRSNKGHISKQKFRKLLKASVKNMDSIRKGLVSLQNTDLVFFAINKDGTKILSYNEFSTALRLFGSDQTDEEMKSWFYSCCTNPDLGMTLEDFTKTIRTASASTKAVYQRIVSSHVELESVHKTISRLKDTIDPLAYDILCFWFPRTLFSCLELWFGKNPDTDQEIENRFKHAVEGALAGKYHHFVDTPSESVALCILLDQFPRNIYRHSPLSFASDSTALSVVMRVIFKGYHKEVTKLESVFFCLVLTHSELIQHQILCLEMWKEISHGLSLHDPLRKFDSIFQKHLLVIEQFGRFPHRNQVLGRESQPEEEKFLEDPNYRFDLPMKEDGTGFGETEKFLEKSAMIEKYGKFEAVDTTDNDNILDAIAALADDELEDAPPK
jgi:uncharacterized protein (DUF924 family)/Ca2+-binding EF-hand superfamily protein